MFLLLMLYGCVFSVYCVGFVPLDVVCDELHGCTWNVGLWKLSD